MVRRIFAKDRQFAIWAIRNIELALLNSKEAMKKNDKNNTS
jgi:hypothetical protein